MTDQMNESGPLSFEISQPKNNVTPIGAAVSGTRFDAAGAIANLAVNVVSMQKDIADLKNAVAQVANQLSVVATAHNNLVSNVDSRFNEGEKNG